MPRKRGEIPSRKALRLPLFRGARSRASRGPSCLGRGGGGVRASGEDAAEEGGDPEPQGPPAPPLPRREVPSFARPLVPRERGRGGEGLGRGCRGRGGDPEPQGPPAPPLPRREVPSFARPLVPRERGRGVRAQAAGPGGERNLRNFSALMSTRRY